jgi:hypothetical protein
MRILVHAVAVLTFLPVGWCCWLPAAHADEPKAADAAPCCCCAEKPAPKPKQTPSEETPQLPSCCCDPQPALAPDDAVAVPRSKLVLALDAVFNTSDIVAVEVSTWQPLSAVLRTHSPPLHLLHCVWLC